MFQRIEDRMFRNRLLQIGFDERLMSLHGTIFLSTLLSSSVS